MFELDIVDSLVSRSQTLNVCLFGFNDIDPLQDSDRDRNIGLPSLLDRLFQGHAYNFHSAATRVVYV